MGGKIEFLLQGDESERTCYLNEKIQRFGHVLHALETALAAMLAFDEATLQFASSQCDLLPALEVSPTPSTPVMLSWPRRINHYNESLN